MGELTVGRAPRQCKTCPFREADEAYRREAAKIDPCEWPCHSVDLYGDDGIQCRGHYEARRKFNPLPNPVEGGN